MLVFTDWVAGPRLSRDQRAQLRETLAAVDIETQAGYRHLLARCGFGAVHADDLTMEWGAILRARLEMYRGLREPTVARFGSEHFARWERNYADFVDHVSTGRVGGVRLHATRS
jgi:hypothetical protein